MNVISVLALAVIIVNVILGLKEGMVRTLFMTFGFVIALIFAAYFSPQVSGVLEATPVFNAISGRIEKGMIGEVKSVYETTERISQLSLPKVFKSSLNENNNETGYNVLGVSNFEDYVSDYSAKVILRIVMFVILFVLIMLLLRYICMALNLLANLPVISSMNMLGGGICGFINGLILLWLIFMFIMVFAGSGLGNVFYSQVTANPITGLLYNNNLILNMITDILK